MSTTAADLRARRARLKVTVKALARRAGYTPEHTSAVLNEHEPGSLRAFRALSDALDAFEREAAEAREAAPINQ